jgi:hypothetical protein
MKGGHFIVFPFIYALPVSIAHFLDSTFIAEFVGIPATMQHMQGSSRTSTFVVNVSINWESSKKEG